MKNLLKPLIYGVALVVAAVVVGNAYTSKFRNQDLIVVTGLGEQEFMSDLIVWRGWIVEQSQSIETGYTKLESNKQKVKEYIKSMGIADSCVVFMFVNVNKLTEPIYNGGNYVGTRFSGYELRQEFRVESTDVEPVERVSREISSLIAKGVQMESFQPEYYYTKLADLKLQLVERATLDARTRALNIAEKSGAKIKNLANGRLGVFQITGANADEQLSSGGNFNTSSKNKKASVTIKLEYHIK